jgi:hypothetical protein
MRDRISSSSEFDDARHWEFVRNSRLPLGTFKRRHDPDHLVFWVCVAILVAMLVLPL